MLLKLAGVAAGNRVPITQHDCVPPSDYYDQLAAPHLARCSIMIDVAMIGATRPRPNGEAAAGRRRVPLRRAAVTRGDFSSSIDNRMRRVSRRGVSALPQ
jgi:hypothetical protein